MRRCPLLVLVLAAGAASAQSSWALLFPDLPQKPAPEWCVEGTRLLYSSAAASIRQDPNDRGGGGMGYTTVDVVGMDQQKVALLVTSWGGPDAPNGISVIAAVGSTGFVGAGEDWWVHPSVLAGATRLANDELAVVEMPHTAGGRQYQGVRFQYERPTSRNVYVLDQATGILLFSSFRAGPAEGNRSQGQNEFLGRRRMHYPWSEAPLPAWLAGWQGMTGRGTQTVAIPGATATAMGMEVRIVPKSRGSRWLVYELTTALALPLGPPQVNTVTLVGGNAQYGGIWLPPEGLAELKPGQVLEEDPVLQYRRTVLAADRRMVVTREQGQRYVVDLTWDAGTGRLARYQKTEQAFATTTYDIIFP